VVAWARDSVPRNRAAARAVVAAILAAVVRIWGLLLGCFRLLTKRYEAVQFPGYLRLYLRAITSGRVGYRVIVVGLTCENAPIVG